MEFFSSYNDNDNIYHKNNIKIKRHLESDESNHITKNKTKLFSRQEVAELIINRNLRD